MSVRKGRPQALREVSPAGSTSACALLGEDVTSVGTDLEIFLPPGLLDDLHDPSLVITSAYVGPERRNRYRPSRRYRPDRARRRPGRGLRVSQVVVVMVATAAAVVPLSLIVAHAPMAPAAAHLAASHRSAAQAHAARTASGSRRPGAGIRHRKGRIQTVRSITADRGLAGGAAAASAGRLATAPAAATAVATATGVSATGALATGACQSPATPAMVNRCARVAARSERRAQRVADRSARAARRASLGAVINP